MISLIFRFLSLLAFICCLGIISVLFPNNLHNGIFILSSVLLSLSISLLLFIKIGPDPAASAIGISLISRPILLLTSTLSFTFCLCKYENISLSLDILYGFLFILFISLRITSREFISKTQEHHKSSSWYNQTMQDLANIIENTDNQDCKRILDGILSDFKYTNKISISNNTGIQTNISDYIRALKDNCNNIDYVKSTEKSLSRLINQYNNNTINFINGA